MAGRIPQLHFDVLTYTGNGGELQLGGLKFSPDLVWIKSRTETWDHVLFDTVRGAELRLQPNLTQAEDISVSGVTQFSSDGFTIGNNNRNNKTGVDYVAWCWNAGEETKVIAPSDLNNDAYNQDQVWSATTGAPQTGTVQQVFDGDTTLTTAFLKDKVTLTEAPFTASKIRIRQNGLSEETFTLTVNETLTYTRPTGTVAEGWAEYHLGASIDITKLEYQWNHPSGSYTIGAVEADGKILADTALQDDSQTWSQTCTPSAGTQSGLDFTKAFNGSLDKIPVDNNFAGWLNTAGAITITFPAGITVQSSVTVWSGDGLDGPATTQVTIGTSTTSVAGTGYVTRKEFSGSGELQQVILDTGGGGARFYGIAVDGVLLVDPGVTYSNVPPVPSIETTLRANPDGGFSVANYTGTGSTSTFAHGLGVEPDLLITKSRTNSQNWAVQTKVTGPTKYFYLNENYEARDLSGTPFWNDTAPTAQVVTVGNDNDTNANNQEYVAYSFSSVPGVSSIGSYTGNGDINGPMINCGFKPRYIMVKRAETAGDWLVWDTARFPNNPNEKVLQPNQTGGDNAGYAIDILSNGFKFNANTSSMNASGGNYIYMAFAEKSQAKPVMETIQFEPDVYSTWDRKQYDFTPGDSVEQVGTSQKLTGEITSVTDNANGTQTIVTTNDVGTFDIGDTLTQVVDITTTAITDVTGNVVTLTDSTNVAGFDVGTSFTMTFDAAGTITEYAPETSTVVSEENIDIAGDGGTWSLVSGATSTSPSNPMGNWAALWDDSITSHTYFDYGTTGSVSSRYSYTFPQPIPFTTLQAYVGSYDGGTIAHVGFNGVTGPRGGSAGSEELIDYTSTVTSPLTSMEIGTNSANYGYIAQILIDGEPLKSNNPRRRLTFTDNTDLNLFREGDKIVNGPVTGFQIVTYSGNSTTNKIKGLGFSPDLIWLKNTTSTTYAAVADTLRGPYYFISPDRSDAQRGPGFEDDIVSFDEDGFTLGADTYYANVNQSGQQYIAWCWDAGEETVTNTEGSQTAEVRANTELGFSVVKYNGAGTIGHGLGATPAFALIKGYDQNIDWSCWHVGLDANNYFYFNLDEAQRNASVWNPLPNNNTFTSFQGGNQIAYVWVEKAGLSKFGTYTGTGNIGDIDIDCGFKPSLIMVKAQTRTGDWVWSYGDDQILYTNGADGATTYDYFDVSDTGFTVKYQGGQANESGQTYIYAAWAAQEEVATVLEDGDTTTNQLVVDGGTWDISNQSEVWSKGTVTQGSNGGFYSNSTPEKSFDGNLTTQANTSASNNNGNITWTPTTPVAYTSSVRAYSNGNVSGTYSFNGGGDTSYGSGWITLASGSGTITSINTNRDGDGFFFSAIEVDGKILVNKYDDSEVWTNSMTGTPYYGSWSRVFDGTWGADANGQLPAVGTYATFTPATPIVTNKLILRYYEQESASNINDPGNNRKVFVTIDGVETMLPDISATMSGGESQWVTVFDGSVDKTVSSIRWGCYDGADYIRMDAMQTDEGILIDTGVRYLGATTALGKPLSASGNIVDQGTNTLTLSTVDKVYKGTYLNDQRIETASIVGLDEDTNSITISQ